ncbi:GD17711 [Drosophila simulans]|uniref:GD17711 n=1 Tax=Drosophila simulans TaxID=7240 RepID=B4NSU1_DROSI|nr:GD17711 [Drosophila simulans]
MHYCPSTYPKAGSGESGEMGGAFGGPSVQKYNYDVGIHGIVSGAAMQDAGEHGVRHGKHRTIRWDVTKHLICMKLPKSQPFYLCLLQCFWALNSLLPEFSEPEHSKSISSLGIN